MENYRSSTNENLDLCTVISNLAPLAIFDAFICHFDTFCILGSIVIIACLATFNDHYEKDIEIYLLPFYLLACTPLDLQVTIHMAGLKFLRLEKYVGT